ncbi:hypothetical protein CANCADRAFT_108999 [Tortispora caseinolytica NRRL Y-17796]|uniref:C3H1-type domain-containing protein n=1 Tax=Tortispora caseinolytica NRRL Y-17796 TaxID=767744 RepID=A0A1E4TFY4_9ASCO|nr:hypothetical protein CANCADRAFT_108999 [Tortispora caseinolytica NRRL Y-17796]
MEPPEVVCEFYAKIGACRHGKNCTKKHIDPQKSNTMVCVGLAKKRLEQLQLLPQQNQTEAYNDIFADIYHEAVQISPVINMLICENQSDHLAGNVYLQFPNPYDAEKAVNGLNAKWYDGRPVFARLTPMRRLTDAICVEHDENTCSRGGQCNYIHNKRPSKDLEMALHLYRSSSHNH